MGFKLATSVIGHAAIMAKLDTLKDAASGSPSRQVGTDVEYAPFVEHGTSRMAAQPFLYPAAEEVNANIPYYVKSASSLEAAVDAAALAVERGAKERCPVDTGNLRASIRVTDGPDR